MPFCFAKDKFLNMLKCIFLLFSAGQNYSNSILPRQNTMGRINGRENMNTIEGIKEILARHKDELRESFKLKEIGVFGSYVRGQQKEKSDVDILVEFEEVPGLFKFIELEDYLEEILRIKVDLVMKSALKPVIGKYILREVVYL